MQVGYSQLNGTILLRPWIWCKNFLAWDQRYYIRLLLLVPNVLDYEFSFVHLIIIWNEHQFVLHHCLIHYDPCLKRIVLGWGTQSFAEIPYCKIKQFNKRIWCQGNIFQLVNFCLFSAYTNLYVIFSYRCPLGGGVFKTRIDDSQRFFSLVG